MNAIFLASDDVVDDDTSKMKYLWRCAIPMISYGTYYLFCRRRGVVKNEKLKEDPLHQLVAFYTSSIAANTSLEVVTQVLELKNMHPVVPGLINTIHMIIPYTISYYIDHRKQIKQDKKDSNKPVEKIINRLISGIKSIVFNKYVYGGIGCVISLRLISELLIPYTVLPSNGEVEWFSNQFYLDWILKLRSWSLLSISELSVWYVTNYPLNLLYLLSKASVIELVFILYAYCEECSWREFVLPRLKETGMGFWKSSILSGTMWAIWKFCLYSEQYQNLDFTSLLVTIASSAMISPIFSFVSEQSRLQPKGILTGMMRALLNSTPTSWQMLKQGSDITNSMCGVSGLCTSTFCVVLLYLLQSRSNFKARNDK
jgi:hypothetical protein